MVNLGGFRQQITSWLNKIRAETDDPVQQYKDAQRMYSMLMDARAETVVLMRRTIVWLYECGGWGPSLIGKELGFTKQRVRGILKEAKAAGVGVDICE